MKNSIKEVHKGFNNLKQAKLFLIVLLIISSNHLLFAQKENDIKTDVPKADLPFYVYKEGDKNPYYPSAYMGNYKALTVDLKSTEDVKNGAYSLKISYDSDTNWYGLGLVNPDNDWGDKPGGYNISGAKTFSFWAKCSQDERKATIGFGMIKNDKPFPDTAIKTKEIKLSTKWEKYTFKLKKEDLSCIRSGFVIFSTGFKEGHNIYIDDIVFN